jgi:hypothetical protein
MISTNMSPMAGAMMKARRTGPKPHKPEAIFLQFPHNFPIPLQFPRQIVEILLAVGDCRIPLQFPRQIVEILLAVGDIRGKWWGMGGDS